MSLEDFDWSTFIAEVTEIPTDVVFQIVEDGEIHEIKAHKMVVGMVSPTFKTMFYTTDIGDKTSKEIEIKASTKQAFQIINDALYKIRSIQDSLQGKSLQKIFDVVAEEAIHQSSLFQKEANLLLLVCAKFIKPKLKDVNSIFNYFEDNGDKKEVVSALMVLMNGIGPTECSNIGPKGCSNCGYEDCQNGKEVKEGEFREGLLVTNNRAASYYSDWNNHDRGTGKVKKVDATHIAIETIKGGVVKGFIGTNYFKTAGGFNLFLFKCN